MSVLVKGMEMPECCDACVFSYWSNLHQTAACKLLEYNPCFDDFSREYKFKRSCNCPLVEILVPHGRMIDADAFLAKYKHGSNWDLEKIVGKAETIIEQEEEPGWRESNGITSPSE